MSEKIVFSYAENADGKMVHVDSVLNGDKCMTGDRTLSYSNMARSPIPFNGYIEPQENEFFLIVNIKNTFYCNDVNDSVYYRENLYECTRKYWKMAADKPEKITKVLGHVDGIVQCVITPTSWYRTNVARVLGRFECDGIVEDDSPYLGKSVKEIVKIGQNPVNYYTKH